MKKSVLKSSMLVAYALTFGTMIFGATSAFADMAPDLIGAADRNTLIAEEQNNVEGNAGHWDAPISENAEFTVKGGTWFNIFGGWASSEDAENNTVTINGGTVENVLVGGYSFSGSASNNTVIINGGRVTEVYGGRSEGGSASNNTVVLGNINDKNGKADIIKKVVVNDAAVGKTSGGTLTIFNKGNVIGTDLLATGTNINFYINSEDMDSTGSNIMLEVKNLANIQNSTINAAVRNVGSVKKDDKITLLKAGVVLLPTLGSTQTWTPGKAPALSDGLMEVDLKIERVENSIIATALADGTASGGGNNGNNNGIRVTENAKSPVETQVVGVAMVNAGSDMITSKGFGAAAEAISGNVASGASSSTMTPFASVGGSSIRQNSGSHVDMKSWNMDLGFAKDVTNSKGKLMFGPIVEYGRGSYDSYLDNGTHGSGNSSFWGIGGIVKQTNTDGLYYEGSLRAGKIKNDYSTSSIGTGMSYDNSAAYVAVHAGLGKVVTINDANSIDYYGKLFYSRQNGSNATLSNGSVYDFDAVNSVRSKIGFRYNHAMDVKNSLYAGLAWQHEFNSEARATINGYGAPAPSVKGETGVMELGWKLNPSSNNKFELDLGMTGYIGKQKGVGGSANFMWHF